jgi:hypothetical protein
MTALEGWENFYVIVGCSAGGLIGLQFVVIALIAEMPITRADPQAGSAFATPSVVHFGVVLLLSAILTTPWNGITPAAVLWGLVGLFGVAYSAIVTRRMRIQSAYKPVLEDWLFHSLLPFVTYAMLAGSAFVATSQARPAMFLVAAASLLLLFIGIHNAWDTVTYYVFTKKREHEK